MLIYHLRSPDWRSGPGLRAGDSSSQTAETWLWGCSHGRGPGPLLLSRLPQNHLYQPSATSSQAGELPGTVLATVNRGHPDIHLDFVLFFKKHPMRLLRLCGSLFQAHLLSQFRCGLKKFNLKGRLANDWIKREPRKPHWTIAMATRVSKINRKEGDGKILAASLPRVSRTTAGGILAASQKDIRDGIHLPGGN